MTLSIANFKGAAQVNPGATFKLDKHTGGPDTIATSKSTLGNRFVSFMREAGIVRTANPATVAFKAALRAEMGDDKVANKLFKKLGLGDHKPLTERTLTRAADYTERLKACKDAPMFQHLGQTKFTQYMMSVDKAVAKNGTNTHGMNDLEKVGIYGYTTSDFGLMNTALRMEANGTGTVPAGLKDYIDHAKSGLAKLPDAPGDSQRGVGYLPPEVDGLYKKGATVTEHAFTSTSVGQAFDGAYTFTIAGQHGKDVSGFSKYPDEREILFPPGTQFQVLARDNNAVGHDLFFDGAVGGQIHITMREV